MAPVHDASAQTSARTHARGARAIAGRHRSAVTRSGSRTGRSGGIGRFARAIGVTLGLGLGLGLALGVGGAAVVPGVAAPAHAADAPQITAPHDGDTVYRVDFTANGEQASGFDVSGTADKGQKNAVLSYWRSEALYEAAKPCFTAKPAADCALQQESTSTSGTPQFRFDGQPITVADDGTWRTRINMTQWLKGAEAGEYDITLAVVITSSEGGASIGDPVRVVYDSKTTQDAAKASTEPAPSMDGPAVPLWVWLIAAFLVLDVIALLLILRLRRNKRIDAEREEASAPRRSTHREPPAV